MQTHTSSVRSCAVGSSWPSALIFTPLPQATRAVAAAIAVAESVVFMVGGRVAAHATHTELMANQSAYRELVEAFEADRSAPEVSL